MAWNAGDAFVDLGLDEGALGKGLSRVRGMLASTQRDFARLGRAARTGLMIGGAAMALSTREAVKYEEQMSFVATMLGEQASRWMPEFSTAIQDMSIKFGQSTATISRGAYDLLSAGVPASQMLEALATASAGAVGGFADTAVVVDAATSVINSFNLSAQDMGDVIDWMSTIVDKGKVDMTQLAGSIGNVAAEVFQAGVSMETFGSIVSTMTAGGVPLRIALTRIRAMMMATINPTASAAEAAKKHGVMLGQEAIAGDNLLNLLKQLADLPSEAIAQIFPQRRAMAGFDALRGRIKKMGEDIEAQYNRAGNAQTKFALRSDDAGFAWNRARQSLVALAENVGRIFLPGLLAASDAVREGIAPLRDWTKVNGELVVSLTQAAAAGLAVVFLFPKLIGGVNALLGAMVMLTAHPLVALATAAAGLAIAFTMLNSEGATMGEKFVNWWASLKALAIPVMIAIRTQAIAAFTAIRPHLEAAWKLLKGLGDQAAATVIAYWGWMADRIREVAAVLEPVLGPFVEWFRTSFVGAMITQITTLVDAMAWLQTIFTDWPTVVELAGAGVELAIAQANDALDHWLTVVLPMYLGMMHDMVRQMNPFKLLRNIITGDLPKLPEIDILPIEASDRVEDAAARVGDLTEMLKGMQAANKELAKGTLSGLTLPGVPGAAGPVAAIVPPGAGVGAPTGLGGVGAPEGPGLGGVGTAGGAAFVGAEEAWAKTALALLGPDTATKQLEATTNLAAIQAEQLAVQKRLAELAEMERIARETPVPDTALLVGV